MQTFSRKNFIFSPFYPIIALNGSNQTAGPAKMQALPQRLVFPEHGLYQTHQLRFTAIDGLKGGILRQEPRPAIPQA